MANRNNNVNTAASASEHSVMQVNPLHTVEGLQAIDRKRITYYNIEDDGGKILWYQTTLDDAHRLIDANTALPDQYPDWQGTLTIKAIRETPRRWTDSSILTSADNLPFALTGPNEPLLEFKSTTLGLGLSADDEIHVAAGALTARINVELALLYLDRFAEPSRAILAKVIAVYFGLSTLERV